MNTTNATKFFSDQQRSRILDHMNDDHADAVLNYARHFGDKTDARSAKLVDIDQESIFLEAETDAGQEPLRIQFPQPLATPDEAHVTLVVMAKQARREEALRRARETARRFESDFKTVILGTCSPQGEPDASVAPAVLRPDRAFYIYISELSRHTSNILATKRASVLIMEDEAASDQLLARKRLTFPCSAKEVPQDDPNYSPTMADLTTKFGPIMEHLAKMSDFHMIRLAPEEGRLVNGFGEAYDVDPMDWAKLSHVGGKGHGRQRQNEAKKENKAS